MSIIGGRSQKPIKAKPICQNNLSHCCCKPIPCKTDNWLSLGNCLASFMFWSNNKCFPGSFPPQICLLSTVSIKTRSRVLFFSNLSVFKSLHDNFLQVRRRCEGVGMLARVWTITRNFLFVTTFSHQGWPRFRRSGRFDQNTTVAWGYWAQCCRYLYPGGNGFISVYDGLRSTKGWKIHTFLNCRVSYFM